jgi:chemotaxis protein MotA
MKNKNLIGLILSTILFLLGFALNGNIGLYFSFSGFLVVVFGTLAASLISYKLDRLVNLSKVLYAAYRRPLTKESEIINILIDLSIRSRMEGLLSLQNQENETTILFLRRALGCLVDGYKVEQIRDILNTEMYFFRLRREDAERTLRTIANYCPTFGLIGSVVGLIAMIGGIGDTSVILQAIPVALTSTLYGLVLSTFFFLPFASKVKDRTSHELLMQKIIMEGVIAISSEVNPIILRTKLESFLTPSERETDLVSYAKLKERFNIERELKNLRKQEGEQMEASEPTEAETLRDK